jgi:hypothetical protein
VKLSSDFEETEQAVKLLKDKIKARGARGIIGLQRIFRIMDDDGNHLLSQNEF